MKTHYRRSDLSAQNRLEIETLEERLMLSTVQVFAAGETGEESMNLSVDGQVLQTWNNVGGNYDTGVFQSFELNTTGTVTAEQVRVSFTNDGLSSTGADRNLRVDKILIDGVTYESEAPENYIEGTWLPATGCSAGNLQSEFLNCNGFIQFASTEPADGSEIVLLAAGSTGEEQVKLKIDGQVVRTFNDIGGDYTAGVFVNLAYTHTEIVDISQIAVEYTNDGPASNGADRNLRLDAVSVDGTVFQAEGPDVYVSGHWVTGTGCSEGFLQTETIECGGFFDFNGATYQSGGFKLSTNLVNVDETASDVTVTVLREGGTTGTVTIDYHTFENTASAGTDFTLVDGTLSFADGETSKTVVIPILDDTEIEGEERFSLTIDNPGGGASLLSPRTTQIVIADNETLAGDTLLAHWKFDEADIGTALNAAGSDNVATHLRMATGNSGPIAETPLLNLPNPRSLNFDGVNDYVRVTGNPNLTFSSDAFTASAWVRPEFTDNGMHGVLYGNNNHYPDIRVIQGSKVAVRFGNGSVAKGFATPAGAVTTNAWNHIGVTFDGTLMRIYVNGELSRTTAKFSGYTTVAPNVVDIGRRRRAYFDGQIDEVQIHDRTLSATEIAELAVDQRDEVSAEVIANYGGAGSIDWTPNGDKMFIGDIAGVVRIFENGSFLPTPFIDISDQVNATRGMLDIAVHPDFVNNPYVYLAFGYDPPEVNQYSGLAGPDGAGNRASRLIRVTADVNNNYQTAVPGSEVILLGKNSVWQYYNGFVDSTVDFDEPQGGVLPDGSYVQDFLAADSVTHTIDDVLFGPDGMLYVSNGDGASYNQVDPRAARVQDIDSLSGKVLRIDPLTGEGLSDNPFYNGDVNANRSKVYYLGLRNPYRMNFSPNDGLLYVGDVGWFQFEELNAGAPGTNFGWPFYEGGTVDAPLQTIHYQDLPEAIAFYASGVETSGGVLSLEHADDAIDAIIAGDFYDGTVYDASYDGDFFYNHFGSGFVRQVSFNADGTIDSIQTFADNMGNIVQMPVGPDGYMYFVDIVTGVIGRWVIS